MDKSAYQRSHMSRRRKYPSHNARNQNRRPRFISFILTCAGIFLFAVGINYIFPHFSKAVGDKVSTVVDYRAAFAVIGEGISGEKKLGDALQEAWAEAFDRSDSGDDLTVMAGNFESESQEPAPANNSSDIQAEASSGSNTELRDALLAAYTDSQYDYADYMTPAGMDYSLI